MNNTKKNSVYFILIAVMLILLCTSIFGHTTVRMDSDFSCAKNLTHSQCQILETMTQSILPSVIGLVGALVILVLSLVSQGKSIHQTVNLSFVTFYQRRHQNFSVVSCVDYYLSQGIINPKLF